MYPSILVLYAIPFDIASKALLNRDLKKNLFTRLYSNLTWISI